MLFIGVQTMKGWIGVDLDGTLAYYDGWHGALDIGPPITLMADRIKQWVASGREVRIFTARVATTDQDTVFQITNIIQQWLRDNDLPVLQVTNQKDFGMIELWDDRAVQVESNTGRRMDGQPDPVGPS